MIKLTIILFFLILILSLVIYLIVVLIDYNTIYSNKISGKTIPGKTIWLLWLQDWENAPLLQKKVKESWIKHNPDWNIELVSYDNLEDYVYIPYIYDKNKNISPQALSDIIRLNLLQKHGGVWADATMLCMRPLDEWVYDVLQPNGFFMYRGYEIDGNGPASWFIISMDDTYIIRKWKNKCDEYWTSHKTAHDYRWMDSLFLELYDNDNHFKKEWGKVPYLNCELLGEAHMLAGICNNNDDENLKDVLKKNPPYALKLWKTCDIEKNNYSKFAIELALQGNKKYELHKTIFSYKEIFHNYVMVISDCNNGDINIFNNLCKDHNIQLVVYDKCNFGKNISNNIYIRPLENIGREQKTFLYFIIKNYDNLPDTMIFSAGNLKRHPIRFDIIKKMLKSNNNIYLDHCTGLNEDNIADFTIDNWNNSGLIKADVRPFKKWYEKYIGEWNVNNKGPCYTGLIKTNKFRILQKPLSFYIKLYNIINDNNSEVGHYIERSMTSIF